MDGEIVLQCECGSDTSVERIAGAVQQMPCAKELLDVWKLRDYFMHSRGIGWLGWSARRPLVDA